MLRAFLIVWTFVAGLAAAGLLYIVGWHPQTSAIATRSTGTRTAATADVPSVTAPGRTDGEANRSATSKDNPAWKEPPVTTSTGSGINRSVADNSSPTSTGSIASRRNVAAAEAPEPPAVLPPARPAGISSISGAARDNVSVDKMQENSASSTQKATTAAVSTPDVMPPNEEAALTDPRMADPQPQGSSARSSTTAGATTAASAPLKASPTEPVKSRMKEARLHDQSNEAAVERASRDIVHRTLKQRAQAAQLETRRKERESTRTAAAEDVKATRNETRLHRTTLRGTRIARSDGGLEHLLDDFSRSNLDYLRERTYKVGNGYLVERTTPYGTRYFYEEGGQRGPSVTVR